MNRYAQRDKVLLEMGFSSYREYLDSKLWKSIRARIFRVCSICVCGEPATECHHRSYKRRYLEGRGRIHKYITPVCRKCHQQIEFEGSEKMSLGWANARLLKIQEEAEKRGIKVPKKARISVRRQRRRHDKFLESRQLKGIDSPDMSCAANDVMSPRTGASECSVGGTQPLPEPAGCSNVCQRRNEGPSCPCSTTALPQPCTATEAVYKEPG